MSMGSTSGSLVSIGVPVYNGERYLADALTAISDQTYPNFEVIVSDNASTDLTQEICEEFTRSDDRFRVVRHEENLGASPNFNYVVHEAKGPYFKWATDDDLIAPTFLETCVAALDAAPADVALVYPKTILIDEDGNEIQTLR